MEFTPSLPQLHQHHRRQSENLQLLRQRTFSNNPLQRQKTQSWAFKTEVIERLPALKQSMSTRLDSLIKNWSRLRSDVRTMYTDAENATLYNDYQLRKIDQDTQKKPFFEFRVQSQYQKGKQRIETQQKQKLLLSPRESHRQYKSLMNGADSLSSDNKYLTRKTLKKEQIRNVFKANRRSFGQSDKLSTIDCTSSMRTLQNWNTESSTIGSPYKTYDTSTTDTYQEPERDLRDLNDFIDGYGMKYLYARSAREQPDTTDMDTVRRHAEKLSTQLLRDSVVSKRPNYNEPTLKKQKSTSSINKVNTTMGKEQMSPFRKRKSSIALPPANNLREEGYIISEIYKFIDEGQSDKATLILKNIERDDIEEGIQYVKETSRIVNGQVSKFMMH